ncbi:hypothetical protein F5883DRAFT_595720 [Diaporthe sp. PMI_573]|nr:hypothetical protein F5883DRAFT_595720 [Diaporthaceae sp. PMI_573]
MLVVPRTHLRIASTLLPSKTLRHISSVSHLTPHELQLFYKHSESKVGLARDDILQKPPVPCFLQPQVYHSPSAWIPAEHSSHRGLKRGCLLKVVSWNIDCFSPDPAARASAALGELKRLFGDPPGHLVVMFQEVCAESLQAILEDSWVQGNFALSNKRPPNSLYADVPGESFTLRILDWDAAPYFTLMMVSTDLDVVKCFRAPFMTSMGRDALVVDIPIKDTKEAKHSTESFRLCTTHLESLWEGKIYRRGQLATISALLKGTPTLGSQIVAGLTGGDMNAIDRLEHEFHREKDIELRDVWEDFPAPSIPILKPFQKDISYGRARGNTWGYQSNGKRERKRLDKFLYTGSMEATALNEIHEVTGNLGRLGIGLKTDVEAWEYETELCSVVRGRVVDKLRKEYCSERTMLRRLENNQFSGARPVRTQINAWVSDHFGIAVGVRVL